MSSTAETERQALVEMRAAFFPQVSQLCRRELKQAAIADEVAEDVWTDFVMQHAQRLRSKEASAAYLRIAAIRRCRRLRELQLRSAPVDVETPDEGENPEAALIAVDENLARQRKLSSCIERLTPPTRRLLRMRFFLGLTQESIGRELGVSKQYAGRVIAKALDQLRVCVEAVP